MPIHNVRFGQRDPSGRIPTHQLGFITIDTVQYPLIDTGDWSNTRASYQPGEVVTDSGIQYVCTTAHTTPCEPPSGNWELLQPERRFLRADRTWEKTPSDAAWCIAKGSGTAPSGGSVTQFNLELAFGSGVDDGTYTQITPGGGGFDTVQINRLGTYEIYCTYAAAGTYAAAAGEFLQGYAFADTGVVTNNFSFGGPAKFYIDSSHESPIQGGMGFLHWPTGPTTPVFLASHIGIAAVNQSASNLDFALEVYIKRVDDYMLDPETAIIWTP